MVTSRSARTSAFAAAVAGLAACAPAAPSPKARTPVRAGPAYFVSEAPVAALVPPPPAPRSPFAYANIDPEDDYVVGPPDPRPTCEQDLAAASIAYKPATLPIFTNKKSKITCGAPQVVAYKGSPAKIAYRPSVVITCTMALALARFETLVQEEALRTWGKRVVFIDHVGTYNCREMAAYPGWVSEHSYANAIDIADFVLEDGRTLDVYKHFAPKEPVPKTSASSFLRAVASRAFKEETFSIVLTPFFDTHHSTHFHLDLARYRSDGTRYLGEESP